jgi:hypothetical protein
MVKRNTEKAMGKVIQLMYKKVWCFWLKDQQPFEAALRLRRAGKGATLNSVLVCKRGRDCQQGNVGNCSGEQD